MDNSNQLKHVRLSTIHWSATPNIMCLSRVLTNGSGPPFIWNPSEVGMTLNHTQIISTQWITYFKTTWDHGCLCCCISSLRFCLRLSSTSFNHSFMNSVLSTFHSRSVIQEARVQPYNTLSCLATRLPQLYHSTASLTVPLYRHLSCHVFHRDSTNATLQCLPLTSHWSPPSVPHRLTFGTAALTQSRCQATLSRGEAQSWRNSTYYNIMSWCF